MCWDGNDRQKEISNPEASLFLLKKPVANWQITHKFAFKHMDSR